MSTRNLRVAPCVVVPDEGYVGLGFLFIAVASPRLSFTLILVLCQIYFTMNLTEFAKFLETYSGRDKVLRLLCYSSKWASVISPSTNFAVKFDKFSNQLSACRALLRLFDDVPMLNCTLKYGLGREEKDRALRSIDLLSNIVDQLYYPIEHVAWAIENNYMFVKNNPWSTSSTVFWVISIYLSLMRNLRCLMVLQRHQKCVEGKDDIGSKLSSLVAEQQRYFLSSLKCVLDLVHAVNCLPEGYLWGGKLLKWQVGAVGTVSSIFGLYIALRKKSS